MFIDLHFGSSFIIAGHTKGNPLPPAVLCHLWTPPKYININMHYTNRSQPQLMEQKGLRCYQPVGVLTRIHMAYSTCPTTQQIPTY